MITLTDRENHNRKIAAFRLWKSMSESDRRTFVKGFQFTQQTEDWLVGADWRALDAHTRGLLTQFLLERPQLILP